MIFLASSYACGERSPRRSDLQGDKSQGEGTRVGTQISSPNFSLNLLQKNLKVTVPLLREEAHDAVLGREDGGF